MLINMKLPNILVNEFPEGIPISGMSGYGIDKLVLAIQNHLSASMVEVTVNLPYINGDLISMFHQYGIAVYAQHGEESVILSGELPVNVARRFWRYRCE